MPPAMSTHTAYEHAIESLREVGKEVGKEVSKVGQRVPVDVPGNLDWPDIDWPDDLVARVAEDVADGLGTVKTVVTPAAAVAAGVGAKAATSTGRFVRQHPLLVAAGIGATIALVIWIVRRGGSASDATTSADHTESVSQVA
jgi:hypothetical protein